MSIKSAKILEIVMYHKWCPKWYKIGKYIQSLASNKKLYKKKVNSLNSEKSWKFLK